MNPTKMQLGAFAAASRRAAAYGLMKCSSGNLSYRLDAEYMLVKASRAWMSDLTDQDIAVCRIADGVSVNELRPSVEIGFHAGVLRTRPDVRVVLHFQSPAATTLACGDPAKINFFVTPEIPYYIGPIGIVPYILPGTPRLAEAVVEAMKTCDLAILASHGMVTVGASYDEAIQRAVFFEMGCDLLLRGGSGVHPLSDEAVAELRAARAAPKAGV